MQELVLFYPQGHEAHAEYGHPERPERVDAIRAALTRTGWWDEFPHLEPESLSKEILESVHTPEYLLRLETLCKAGQRLDMDTYTTPASWDLALNAAGGAVAVAKTVWRGEAQRGFALTRPPGHHATINRGMGFCLINNVPVAAEYLLQEEGAAKLAIIDLDQHHGNGTQDIFWDREDVLYISTHQYPHYPGTGRVAEIGAGRGEGFTANFPLPALSGDQAFKAVMTEAIIPLIDRFQPEMILVSYGFDTHWKDPLGHLLLTAQGYADLISQLTLWADQNCQGRIALFLEGGYNLEAAAACTQGVVAALLGRIWQDPLGPAPQPETETWKPMLKDVKRLLGLEN